MLANASTLTGVFEEFKALFAATLQTAPVPFDLAPFIMDVPTSQITVDYNWLGDLPAMRKWVGDRIVKDLKAFNYSVTNSPYEATIGVKIRDVEADNLGVYRPRIQMLAQQAVRNKLALFAAVLNDNPVCFDGQNLIDTDHPLDNGSTYTNKGTTALSLTSLAAGLLVGQTLVDSNSDPLGVSYTHLMVPPALRATAFQIVASERLPGSANNDANPYQNIVQVVVNPYLSDTNNWCLFDTNLPAKAVVYQHRKEATFARSGPDAEFIRGEVQYGIDSDWVMAAGLPQAIYGAIVT